MTLFSLQKGLTEGDAAPPGMEVVRLSDDIHDFEDTAAIVAGLDLVITVDTSVCHLAGSLGVPTWTLLSRAGEWRWGHGHTGTPWYPSMRLWRQGRMHDWAELMGRVATALREEAGTD